MNLILLSGTNTANAAVYKNNNCACLYLFVYVIIANEQPREDERLRGGIVPGVEKISNRCNIE